jgi:hypothetical protein
VLLTIICYMLFQYLLILLQLISGYDLILNERLRFRRLDELKTAKAHLDVQRIKDPHRHVEASPELKALHTTRHEFELQGMAATENLMKLVSEKAKVGKVSDTADIANLDKRIAFEKSAEKSARRRVLNISETMKLEIDRLKKEGLIPQKSEEEVAAEQAWISIATEDISARFGYKKLEILIDIVRLGLPVGVSVYGIALLTIWGGHNS